MNGEAGGVHQSGKGLHNIATVAEQSEQANMRHVQSENHRRIHASAKRLDDAKRLCSGTPAEPER